MPATYENIATTTLTATSTTITFSSISGSYTDLRVVLVGTNATPSNLYMQYNDDTSANYSQTKIQGNGTTAASTRTTGASLISLTTTGQVNSTPHFYTIDLFSYAGSTQKTALSTSQEDDNGSGEVRYIVSLWRSTAAITSIKLYVDAGSFNSGTTATLYGILKA